jgi:hypothetical protein
MVRYDESMASRERMHIAFDRHAQDRAQHRPQEQTNHGAIEI